MNQKIDKHLTTLKTFGKFGPPYRKAFGIQPRKSTTISLCTQVLRREIPTSHLVCLLVLLHYLHQRIIPYDTKQAVSKVPKEKSFSKSQKKKKKLLSRFGIPQQAKIEESRKKSAHSSTASSSGERIFSRVFTSSIAQQRLLSHAATVTRVSTIVEILKI